MEAHDYFRKATKPFFAYIQTSGNHRPFDKTMASSDTDFVKLKVTDEQLKKYGFESLDEFNSFRYFDYCIRRFIVAAQQEKYFHNTIFVFVGDHGVAGNAEALYPPVWTEQRLTDEHVPLLFYAPQLLIPQRRSEVVSQIDVLPTIAGMLHRPYVNTTLGRDLLDPAKKNNYAFITNTADVIGMVTDDFYFTKNINSKEEQISPMHYTARQLSRTRQDTVKRQLSVFADAFFETARYMLMNNAKE
jgi:phosphoglycerol transferase MdoB-like AlkP superfamily enzyme